MEEGQDYHHALVVKTTASLQKQVAKLIDKLLEQDIALDCFEEAYDRLQSRLSEATAKITVLKGISESFKQEKEQVDQMKELVTMAFAVGKPDRRVSFSAIPIGMAAQSVHQRNMSEGAKIAAIHRQVRKLININRERERQK